MDDKEKLWKSKARTKRVRAAEEAAVAAGVDLTSNKVCTKCLVAKPLDEFYVAPKSRGTRGLLRWAMCIKCVRARANKAQAEKPHMLTAMKIQGGKCAICGGEFKKLGKKRGAHMDHDHDTGELRGLLCSGCNVGIGHLGDNPDLLRVAIMYLEHPPLRLAKAWGVSP